MRAYIGDIRFHPHREVDVDEWDAFHVVATWPTAKCGADLSDRKHRQQSLIGLANEGKPFCAECIEAEAREADARLAELDAGA